MLAWPMITWSIFGGYPAWIISDAAVRRQAAAARAFPRTRPQPVPAVTQPNRPPSGQRTSVLPAPGIVSPPKIAVKGARFARVAGAMTLRATLECDLRRQDLGTYQEDGATAEPPKHIHRARCVPDRAGNDGRLRPLTGGSVRSLTCHNAGHSPTRCSFPS